MTFWGNQTSEMDLEYDRNVAQSLRREASARLLALETYPSWRFLVPLYALAAGFFGAWYLGTSIGEKYPASFDYWELSEVDPFLPVFALFGFFFILSGLTGLGLVRLWRKRVMQNYLRADTITRGKKVVFNDKGSPVSVQEQHGDLKLSILQGLGILSFSLGVYALNVLISFFATYGGPTASPMPQEYTGFLLAVGAVGFILTMLGLDGVTDLFTMESTSWKHPMPLTKAAAKTVEDPGQAEIRRSSKMRWLRRFSSR